MAQTAIRQNLLRTPVQSSAPDRALGAVLRRWCMLHRVKQSDAAQRLGVTQSTISRWEGGLLAISPTERRAIKQLVASRLEAAADRVLVGLVAELNRPGFAGGSNS